MTIVLHDLDDFQHVLSCPIATDVTIPLSPSKSITCYDFLNFLTKVFVVLNLEILMLLLLLFLLLREEIARLANLKKTTLFVLFNFRLYWIFYPARLVILSFQLKIINTNGYFIFIQFPYKFTILYKFFILKLK